MFTRFSGDSLINRRVDIFRDCELNARIQGELTDTAIISHSTIDFSASFHFDSRTLLRRNNDHCKPFSTFIVQFRFCRNRAFHIERQFCIFDFQRTLHPRANSFFAVGMWSGNKSSLNDILLTGFVFSTRAHNGTRRNIVDAFKS